MLTCLTLPTESLRILALLALILFETIWLTKKNRRAALVLVAGATIDLFSAIGVPVLEVLVLVYLGKHSNDPGMAMLGMFTIPMLQRLAMAFHLLCVLIGLVLLIRDLPDEEREGSW